MVELPEKGQAVSLEEIELICAERQWYDLWAKIKQNPPEKPFKSDGCSWWPDNWKSKAGKIISIYPRCFEHDLWYWCGFSEKNNSKEQTDRFTADARLIIGVVHDTRRVELGEVMWRGVRAGGHERWNLPFSWGFGRK